MALLSGAGTVIAVNKQPTASANMLHDCIDWNGATIFWGVTQQQAQTFCHPLHAVCLPIHPT
ncbi:hypothetical protein [Chitinophaga silvisoli]|uniref:Uncharacterized protein n=1 Tax=Chitinophaga silvisoli TaxID=2291814 RepID=A0A3E1NKM9_9BACT|nr:hypothetical protein [Chitinophaga silvisoli]RFM28394.1 hypothetical protein DXN04_34240 [Chitinophaga silvisoli]